MKKVLLATAAALLACGWLLGHGKEEWPLPPAARLRPNPVAATPASLAAGKALYKDNCLTCHGERGDGHGSWGERLAVRPADFTDRHMMSEMTDGELYWKLSRGRYPMPSFADKFSETDRWNLVNYIRTFAANGSPSEAVGHHH